MNPLVTAVDAAVAFVREHPDEMARDEVDELKRLSAEVYRLAFAEGLVSALPQISELAPTLEGDVVPLPPVQFEGKLNVPGDWDCASVFRPVATPRWFDDMAMLRSLALGQQSPNAGQSDEQLPTVWYHGERSYSSTGRNPVVVSVEQHAVLQNFLDKEVALGTRELERSVNNPSKICGLLKQKFGDAVRKPEAKGEGYSIRVRSRSVATG